MLPGSICSGSHSVTMFSCATIVTSAVAQQPFSLSGWFHCKDRKTCSRTPAPAGAARALFLRGTPVEDLRPHLTHRVRQADPQQRLARVLEHVDHLALGVFQV